MGLKNAGKAEGQRETIAHKRAYDACVGAKGWKNIRKEYELGVRVCVCASVRVRECARNGYVPLAKAITYGPDVRALEINDDRINSHEMDGIFFVNNNLIW